MSAALSAYQGIFVALQSSFPLIFSAMLLSRYDGVVHSAAASHDQELGVEANARRHNQWSVGTVLGCASYSTPSPRCADCHCAAIYSKFHPWTNYFLMLSSLLYLTAAYNSPNGVPTLREFNQEQQSESAND